jgi:hypothetical protein
MRTSLMPLVVLGVAVASASCGSHEADNSGDAVTIKTSDWQFLQEHRIFFAHQSIGDDILLGMKNLARGQGVGLAIRTAAISGPFTDPGIYETHIGQNGDPQGKISQFAQMLDGGIGQNVDVAILKFCFADIGAATDVESIFARYQSVLAALSSRYPGVTFAHVTVPLQGPGAGLVSSLRQIAKTVLGRGGIGPSMNARREEFNSMMRARYAGREPLFDLARVESTGPDGQVAVQRLDGIVVPRLASEYTDGTDHLNARGQCVVARALVAFLASLPGR